MGSVGPGSGRVAAAGPRTQVRPGVCPDVAGLRMNVNAGFPSAAGFSGARRLLGTTAGGAHPSSRMQLSEEREISAGSVCLNREKKKPDFRPRAPPDGSFFFARLRDASSPLTGRPWRAPDISRCRFPGAEQERVCACVPASLVISNCSNIQVLRRKRHHF